MRKRAFHVTAIWDEEDQIWVSETDIRGLHLEAETLNEFRDLVDEFASELIFTNHCSEEELAGQPMRNVVPTVVFSVRDGSGQAA